jgi:hypothetical protein
LHWLVVIGVLLLPLWKSHRHDRVSFCCPEILLMFLYEEIDPKNCCRRSVRVWTFGFGEQPALTETVGGRHESSTGFSRRMTGMGARAKD